MYFWHSCKYMYVIQLHFFSLLLLSYDYYFFKNLIIYSNDVEHLDVLQVEFHNDSPNFQPRVYTYFLLFIHSNIILGAAMKGLCN